MELRFFFVFSGNVVVYRITYHKAHQDPRGRFILSSLCWGSQGTQSSRWGCTEGRTRTTGPGPRMLASPGLGSTHAELAVGFGLLPPAL